MSKINSFNTLSTIEINGITYHYHSLKKAEEKLGKLSTLPKSMKVLLENLLRHEDNETVTQNDIQAIADWLKERKSNKEIQYRPARVLMQDFTGVPAVVDLAAMRDAMKKAGGDPEKINPLSPVDLVIDHSVMIDSFGLTGAKAEAIPTSGNALLNLDASGNLNITGAGQLDIDLQNLASGNGHYTLLFDANAHKAFNSSNIDSGITLRGQSVALNTRLSGLTLEVQPNAVVLAHNGISNALSSWTGAAGDGVWDILSNNWQLKTEAGAALADTQYIFGDAVAFNDIGGHQSIMVYDGGVTPAGMVVNSPHDYTFNGGVINVMANGTLSPTFATGTIEKHGLGTLTFNNMVAGIGNVHAGKMLIGDSSTHSTAVFIGDIDVYHGATLGGHGQIAGSVTARSGATIAPGNSIGTLSVGDIVFQSGSTYQFEGNPDGAGDKIIATSTLPGATGIAQIDAGAHLNILAGAGTWNPSTSYVILEADDGVTGTFTNVASNLSFLLPTLDYSNTRQIGLTLTRNAVRFANVGVTYNQRSTGSGIESLNAGHPVYTQIVSMDANSARNAFDNLSGEIHASVKSAALTNSRYTRNAINQHLSSNAGEAPVSDRTLWVQTWYHDGHFKGDGNAQKLDNKGFGIMMGADAVSFGSTTLGAAIGYEQSEVSSAGTRRSSADMDAMHLMAYGRTQAGPIDIRGAVGYSFLSVESKRHMGVGSLMGTNKADYDGHLMQAYIEGSHTFKLGQTLDLTPYMNLAYQRVKMDSFTESADLYSFGTQLRHRGSSDSQASSTIGLRGAWRLNAKSDLYADIGWQHTFGSLTPESQFNFIGGLPYNIKGVKTNRNAAVIGFGANFQIKPNMQLSFGYEGLLGNQSRDHSARIQWRMNF